MSGDHPVHVLAFGDSLTAGHGLATAQAFPAQLQILLRRRLPSATVRNAGVSGDTTASALARLPRLLSSLAQRPDLAIVELGANDLLRGIPPAQTVRNLDAILRAFADCTIPVLLAAMEPPPFLGPIATACRALYADIALRHGVASHPFFPADVLGHPELVLRDRLHPNARAIELVAVHMAPAVIAALEQRTIRAA